MNNLFSCRVSNATVSGSLISNLFRASDTREILPGPLQSSFSNTFYADYPTCAGFTPKKDHPSMMGFQNFCQILMFPQVSVANVENAHHSTRQWLFLSELKRKEEPRKHSTRKRRFFCRLLAQTTLRNILGTKNLHEILSDRESISSSMQVVFLFIVVFLFVFARKVVGQFGTNIVKRTTY